MTSHSSNNFFLPFFRISSEQKLAVKFWWQAFDKDQKLICDLFKGVIKESLDIPAWMNQYLHPIDKDIMWEFGPGIKKTHRLVITSETNRLLRPLVQYILSQAPEYKDWEFYGYRLAEDLSETQITMSSRTNWQDLSGIEFELIHAEFNKITINYYVPKSLWKKTKENHVYNSYVLTESSHYPSLILKFV